MTRQNALKYILPIAGVALLLLLAAWAFRLPPVSALTERDRPAVAVQPQPVDQVAGYGYDTINVTGIGVASKKPDLAMLSLGVLVSSPSVEVARTQAAASMQLVITALQENGVADSDIQTTRFSVYADWDWSGDKRELRGYEVSNEISATVREVDTVAAVIDAAVTAGGDDIRFNDVSYAFSDTVRANLERQARQLAVVNMRNKAAQLAQFSGRRLGDLMVISENPVPEVFGGAVREFAAMAADSTPIMVGEKEVSVTIHGMYELR